MRLLGGQLAKLAKRPATRVIFGLFVVALVGIYVALGIAVSVAPQEVSGGLSGLLTFPDAYRSLVALFPLFGGLALAIYAGLVIGSEWSWGTLRLAFTRTHARSRYVLTLFAAIALLALAGMLVAFGIGLLAALGAGTIAGYPRGDLAEAEALIWLPLGLLSAWFGMVVIAALAFTVSLVARSQVAGIGLVVALFFGEQFAGLVLPTNALQLAPLSAASSIGTGDGGLAVVAAVAYLAAALLIGALLVERAEIA